MVSHVDELRERISQLLQVISSFETTSRQLRARLELNPPVRQEIERKLALNERTLESLRRSLISNRTELQRSSANATQ